MPFTRREFMQGGVAAFMAHRDKATWAEWVGPPPPTADDLKSAKAATERLGNRTSSLAIESASVGYDPQDIAAMGVGGLLKEIATRPQPRRG